MKKNNILTFLLLLLICSLFITLYIQKQENITPGDDSNSPKNPEEVISSEETVTEELVKNELSIWGKKYTYNPESKLINNLEIKDVALGSDFVVVLKNDGKIITWGSNDSGQLGRDTLGKDDMNPKEIKDLKDIVAVSTKHKHTLALDNKGNIFAFGSNYTGQLGDGTNIDSFVPKRVNISNIKKISAGHKFSIAIKEDGSVWAWGASCDKKSKEEALELLEEKESLENLGGEYYDESSVEGGDYDRNEDCLNEEVVGIESKLPKKININANIKDITIGYGHALLLDTLGNVWSFGCNLYGQLGRKEFKNEIPNATPQKIPELKNIVSISAGFRHSLALDSTGKVFHWGMSWPTDSEARHAYKTAVPTLLKFPQGLEKIEEISAGRDFSLFLTKNKVLGFGLDNLNIMTKDNDNFIRNPKELNTLTKYNEIIDVIAGSQNSAILFR